MQTIRKRSSEKIVIDPEGNEEVVPQKKKTIAQKQKTLYALVIGIFCGFLSGYITKYLREKEICSVEDLFPYKLRLKTEPGIYEEEESLPDREEHAFKTDTSVAEKYIEKMKILCWVMTSSQYHKTRAFHAKNTWGKRCDILIFFSDQEDKDLPTIKLDTFSNETKTGSWKRLMKALDFLYTHYYFKADWFIKADDTNYIILENLRYLLSHYPKDGEFFMGCRYRHEDLRDGYMVDRAGYVLSKEGLQKIAVVVVPHYEKLLPKWNEILKNDEKLGYILNKIELKIVDTRDSFGKERFHPFDPKTHVFELRTNNTDLLNFYQNRYFKFESGDYSPGCCSETSITFGNISPAHMYLMEYMVYNLRPFGIVKY